MQGGYELLVYLLVKYSRTLRELCGPQRIYLDNNGRLIIELSDPVCVRDVLEQLVGEEIMGELEQII